ncbi:MAG TPA: hypothetical protein QGF35_02570 [Dehalococcoidia bacterium]|jgi:cytochrome b561|nr:hypothetical protein [Dehalococcoidia bacterium]
MRIANYIFSSVSIILGVALVLFIMSQADEYRLRTTAWPLDWNIGTTIGVVLVLNGVIRLWFAQDDLKEDPPDDSTWNL